MRKGTLLVLGLSVALAACGGDPFGAPARVKTHGYRAHGAQTKDGRTAHWEVAARGENRRREPPPGTAGRVLIWRGAERKALELDPATRTYAERPFTSVDEALPGHPLAPGFSEKAEAQRRGIEQYRREADTVYSGHVCWIWRFEAQPGDPASPSTSYWVAPDLDNLVLRVVSEVPKGDGYERVAVSDLTNVRVGADPTLFEPADFKKVEVLK